MIEVSKELGRIFTSLRQNPCALNTVVRSKNEDKIKTNLHKEKGILSGLTYDVREEE